MFTKARLNFVVDLLILVAFLAATVSGLVLLNMPHDGYRGGRNPDFGQTVLLLDRSDWNDLHVWGSLAMIAGIVIHLALHWRWIVCMVKKFLGFGRPSALPGTAQPAAVLVSERDM
jgi:quinol-cytochrome oxidoreductase complex cytochrome b subunit